MSDEIKEFSKDEASSFIYHGTPSQSLMAPVQQAPVAQQSIAAPIVPPKLAMPSRGKASADVPDPTALLETIAAANKKLKEQTPAPEAPSAIGGLVDQVANNWKPIALTAAATYGLTKAAPLVAKGVEKISKRFKERNPGQGIEAVRIEPTFATDQEMRQAEVMAQKPAPTLTPIQNLQQRHAELTAAVQGQAAGAAPGPIPRNQLPVSPSIFSSSPKAPIAPAPSMTTPNVETAVATGGNVTKAVQQDVAKLTDEAFGTARPEVLRTGTGREVIAGQGPVPQRFAKEYKSPTDVPKGFAFVPNAQYIDVLRNDLSQPTYTEQFTNRPFPSTYPEAVESGKNINRELNRPTREQLKAQGAAMPETTEGIVRKVGPNKMVKVGGVAGALVAISDLAKAENTQQRREAVGNALLGLLPLGMDANALNADEAAKLQQLFAQQAYAQKVGGGRSVAPPSMYPQGGLNYNSPRIR